MQLKTTTSDPEYIAERSVWWEEGIKAMIRRPHLSKQVVGFIPGLPAASAVKLVGWLLSLWSSLGAYFIALQRSALRRLKYRCRSRDGRGLARARFSAKSIR